jgi:hypothetical protein
MNVNQKKCMAGIIAFVVLGGLWFLFLSKEPPQLILRNIPNSLFLVSLIAGGVIGFVGDKSGGLIAGIVNFICITLILTFMPFVLKIVIPIPRFIINQLGYILAFSAVGFVSALIGQRFKIYWCKWRNAT